MNNCNKMFYISHNRKYAIESLLINYYLNI